ncbi:histidinol dehydrogenase [Babesia caballi]|uniref:Histidinol dehydrogenase n=1 Tax=Babesia caballi TaxID=5871 RepID=A0AAV4LPA5_BABCB|nr:histidinol dehydrogenase [Babesia caballi]
MDVLDLITSRKAPEVVAPRPDSAGTPEASPLRDYEKRWKQLKAIIRAENAKKQPSSAALKSATDELRDIRRQLLREDARQGRRPPPVSCLDNAPQPPSPAKTVDWSKVASVRKRNRESRRFVFYMPAGRTMGTDVTIGRDRLEKIQRSMNRNTYGLVAASSGHSAQATC